MRWFHRKVAGHSTRFEQECMAYNWAKYGHFYPPITEEPPIWGESWINPRSVRKLVFFNEYMCEPVPQEPETVIPRSRSVGKSEDIRPLDHSWGPEEEAWREEED